MAGGEGPFTYIVTGEGGEVSLLAGDVFAFG
jgi:hypothetical protein